MTPISMVI